MLNVHLNIEFMEYPKVAECAPALVKLEKGKTYAWCTCGLSAKQPFCDGQHKTIDAQPFKSIKFTAEEDTEVWLCRCKHTSNPPYCDGTHNTLAAATSGGQL